MNRTELPRDAESVRALISRLGGKGIRLWHAGEEVRYLGVSPLDPEDAAQIRTQRAEVLAGLKQEGCSWPAYPASHGQRSLWFMDQLGHNADPTYHLLSLVALSPKIELPVLSSQIDRVVERHEILRTNYALQFGHLWQRVRESSTGALQVVSLGPVSEARLLEEAEAFGRAAFDLEAGPIFRTCVFERESGREETKCERVLAFCVHHIAMDFGSLQLLLREISRGVNGQSDSMDVLQYREFVAAELADEGATSTKLERLRTQLTPLPPVLALPWRPELTVRASEERYKVVAWSAGAEQNDAVRSMSMKSGATTFGVCLALYASVLARVSGQSRFVVNLATTLRRADKTKDAIGNYANLTPVKLDVNVEQELEQVVRSVFESIRSALELRGVPFPVLVDAIGLAGASARAPISPVAFSWHRDPPLTDQNAIGTVHPASRQLGPPGALMLTVHEGLSGLDFKLTYDTEMLGEGFARSFAKAIACAFSGMAGTPQARVEELALVEPKERDARERVLLCPRQELQFRNIFQKIADTAGVHPSATAVIAGKDRLSYAQLLRDSNSIGVALQGLGIRAGDRVAVHLRRSVDLVAAILGTLAVGAVYVPIDRKYPVGRVQSLVKISGARCLLVDEPPAFEVDENCQLLPVRQALEGDVTVFASSMEIPADALAYIIFTSGSTGTPKGVSIQHGALANFVSGFVERVGLEHRNRYLAISSISFDASIAEIFAPLVAGAQLVVAGDGEIRNPEALAQLIDVHHIDCMQATPTTWKSLLTAFPERKWSLSAHSMGEALPTVLAQELSSRARSVWNLYGPTEATVYVSACTYERTGCTATPMVPVARPLPGCGLWVLDTSRRQAITGAIGELYLSGPQLAREYWMDPEGTSKAFLLIERPSGPPIRLYKTGDLARNLGDGRVEIIGRLDSQVKLRGYRIDLGEVESTLTAHSAVKDAVVMLDTDAEGGPALIAFVILSESVAQENLRMILDAHLRERVPAYMLPREYSAVPHFPSNANGKTDRKQLLATREPQSIQPSPEVVVGGSARVLLRLLGKILGRTISDPSTNIFDVGIDSLRAVELKMSARRELGIDVPMQLIFERPTIAELGAYCDGTPLVAQASFVADLAAGLPLEVHHEPLDESDSLAPAARHSVLLTGATGYLGSRILRELMQVRDCRVTCLVRGESDHHATERLRASLIKYGVNVENEFGTRIQVVAGVLGTPYFGLASSVLEQLAKTVDAVVHAAALVNFTLPYPSLRSNVSATSALAQFCYRYGNKPLHFVSTYSVMDALQTSIPEVISNEDHPGLDFGYARSKWVAEQLLQQGMDQGLRCTVYRPSRIVSGVGEPLNFSDFYALVLAGSIATGAAPLEAGSDNFVSVSGVARRIARLAIHPDQQSRVVHLCSARWTAWDEILGGIANLGLELERVRYEEWIIRILAALPRFPKLRALGEIAPFLQGAADRLRQRLQHRQPGITVSHFEDGAALGMEFDRLTLQRHVRDIIHHFGLDDVRTIQGPHAF